MHDEKFELVSDFVPKGDQPRAIEELIHGIESGVRDQVLLGVTGSGKTFTIANVIARLGRPTLVMAHNKTLAAQLYSEFRALFPHNAVEYFVSYYDYYQPEAYVPSSDTYIEKDASINDELDKLRLSTTRSVLERRDVIVVSSVSCIYGIGSPEAYAGMLVRAEVGEEISRDRFLADLASIQYKRNDYDFHRGTFRVRGDVVEVLPAYESDRAVRVEFFGDEIDAISMVDPLRGTTIERLKRLVIFPASHYVTPKHILRVAAKEIAEELEERVRAFEKEGKLLEAQRVNQRTRYDLECLAEMGYCQGIENYSRYLARRAPGQPPYTLIDYFPKDFLLVMDESHQTIPQVGAMFRGDRSRKGNLVDYGFRLPSALDNRPLKFEEFEARMPTTIFVSATPADYELRRSEGVIVEQVVRPTGLLDPEIEIRPAGNQVEDLLGEVRARTEVGERTLVTTLTKRMAEELTEYYADLGVRIRYMHSDVETLERVEIIRDLRIGKFDVLVGINLLREGLDLPEVSLVAILDADKEGFLRSERSLIQTTGRAARNVHGKVIMYADRVTDSMARAISETDRRRDVQREYNEAHGITPDTVRRAIEGAISIGGDARHAERLAQEAERDRVRDAQALRKRIQTVEAEMRAEAKAMNFEHAAELRDELKRLQQLELDLT